MRCALLRFYARQVDGVYDIAVFDIVFKFRCSHNRTVVFRFFRRCSKMRNCNDAVNFDTFFVWKIDDVFAYFFVFERIFYCGYFAKFASRCVYDYHAVFHRRYGVCVDKSFGFGSHGHVKRHKVGIRPTGLHCVENRNEGYFRFCRFGYKRIVARDIHTECVS